MTRKIGQKRETDAFRILIACENVSAASFACVKCYIHIGNVIIFQLSPDFSNADQRSNSTTNRLVYRCVKINQSFIDVNPTS